MKIAIYANTDWYLYNFRRSFIVALIAAGHEVVLVSPDGPYVENLLALGARWKGVPMRRRSLNPLRELWLLLFLWRMLRGERPDILHCFTVKSVVYGLIAARMSNVRARVGAVAGMGYVFTSNKLLARILRPVVAGLLRVALGGKGTMLILQNPDDVALFKRGGLVDPRQIRLILGSGVDMSRFKGRARVRSGRHEIRVLLATRLLWEKGVGEYVAAARRLKNEGRNIVFLLAGGPDPGNPESVPEPTVQAWVEEGIVEWLGHVEDMPDLLASVDVVVLPSYYREGVPKILIEAAACGLPLVTTDMPGCREVVADQVDGLLVPPRNADALAEAIARLQDEPDYAARLGAAARRKAQELFDDRVVISRTLAVYSELVNT